MRSLFLAPHSDDETLFGAFTLYRYHPSVAICFRSTRDYGDTDARYEESVWACSLHLGVRDVRQRPMGVSLREFLVHLKLALEPEIVWVPSEKCSHPDHAELAEVAPRVFDPSTVRRYDTYQAGPTKVRDLPDVVPCGPEALLAKLMALTCYKTQVAHPRAGLFFMQDLCEYAEQP